MSALEILRRLKSQGVEITRRGDNLAVLAAHGELTPEQRALILENKTALLAHFRAIEGGPKIAAPEPLPAPVQEDTKENTVYREYKLPGGETLQVTQEEFENVVEIYRMLWKQDQKNFQRRNAA